MPSKQQHKEIYTSTISLYEDIMCADAETIEVQQATIHSQREIICSQREMIQKLQQLVEAQDNWIEEHLENASDRE